MSHSGLRRTVRAISSLVYLCVLLTAPGLDAVLEVSTLDRVAHIEPEKDTICTTGHDEFLCQFCRLLDLPADSGGRMKLEAVRVTRTNTAAAVDGMRTGSSDFRQHRPRAPPSA